MGCRVCGDEKATYRLGKRQYLCNLCNNGTPVKVDRASFDLHYWGAGANEVPESTKREFYSDYLTSTHTIGAYIAATTTQAE
jgi:hypothetical protein